MFVCLWREEVLHSELKSFTLCSERFAEMEGRSEELGDLKNGRDFLWIGVN